MIYQNHFQGRDYLFSTVGDPDHIWHRESYSSELHMREEWWQVKGGDVVIDVGAGFGSYTLSALVAGASLVIACEPHHRGLFSMASSIALNRFLPSRYLLLPHLVCEKPGDVRSFCPRSHAGNMQPMAGSELRLTDTLDRIVADYFLPRLDWVKIDVEGAEEQVIRGGMDAFRACRPRILIEYHEGIVPGVGDRIRGLLSPLGYTERTRSGVGDNDFWGLWTHDAEHADAAA